MRKDHLEFAKTNGYEYFVENVQTGECYLYTHNYGDACAISWAVRCVINPGDPNDTAIGVVSTETGRFVSEVF